MTRESIYGTGRLTGRVAVVTGASSGVGRAIALALARQGAELCAVGRNSNALAETVAAARQFSPATTFPMDLTVEENLETLLQHLEEKAGKVDILVHSAGVIHQDLMERARIEDLDLQYVTNVRAPYLVSQRLLAFLARARGQIVFINSSVGLAVKRPEVGQYAATKYASEGNRRQLARRSESERNPCPYPLSRAHCDADAAGAFPAGRTRVPSGDFTATRRCSLSRSSCFDASLHGGSDGDLHPSNDEKFVLTFGCDLRVGLGKRLP